MKAFKTRNIAVEAQYAKVTKKIEKACKEGRESYEYKHGMLFNEVVKKLMDDGFFVVRNYSDGTTIISWADEIVEENEGELRNVWPIFDDDGKMLTDWVWAIDSKKEIPSVDELAAVVSEALACDDECCCGDCECCNEDCESDEDDSCDDYCEDYECDEDGEYTASCETCSEEVIHENENEVVVESTTADSDVEPVSDSVVEAVAESAVESEPVTEAIAEPTVKSEPVTEAIAEPTVESESVTEAIAESADESAEPEERA